MLPGIITDAGGITTKKGDIDNTKFKRLSYPKAPGTSISKTRYDFEWLINNCDIKKSDIDPDQMINRLVVDQKILNQIKDIVDNKTKLNGVDVKLPSEKDPLGYVYVKNWDGIKEISDNANDPKISPPFIYKLIKSALIDKLYEDKTMGVAVLANNGNDGCVYLTLRSYGFDYTMGELHNPGHVFGSGLALKINNKIEQHHGSGGGHKNACGFKSYEGVDFYKDLLTLINQVVKQYVDSTDDLTKIPPDKYQQMLKMSALNNT